MCFLWALASGLYYRRNGVPRRHPSRMITYQNVFHELENTLVLRGISWPLPVHEIQRVERQNPSSSFNVYTLQYDSEGNTWKFVGPLYFSGKKKEHHFNLLLHSTQGRSHYVWIKNFSRLVSPQHSRHHGRIFACERCLNVFRSAQQLEVHERDCESVGSAARLTLPLHNSMYFRNHERQQRCPIAIYVDFECFTRPVSSCRPTSDEPFLEGYQLHEPFSVGFQIVCDYDVERSRYVKYRGPEAALKLVEVLKSVAQDYEYCLEHPVPLIMAEGDEVSFQNADHCHICKHPFRTSSVRVRDHNHFTGRFRGAAHQLCNVNYSAPKHIPVFFHNGSGYGWHFLLQAWADGASTRLKVLPQIMSVSSACSKK